MTWPRNTRRSKYGARRTRCSQGQAHASLAEARRCDELHLAQIAGAVSQLEAHPQPRYRLEVEGVLVATYVPDFRYLSHTTPAPRLVVEDVKGVRTPAYALKRRLMLACHGIEILETGSRTARRRRRRRNGR